METKMSDAVLIAKLEAAASVIESMQKAMQPHTDEEREAYEAALWFVSNELTPQESPTE
jgi:hypothetical protein